MKQTIYILTLLILSSCGQSYSEQTKNIKTESFPDQISDTTNNESYDFTEQDSTEKNQTEEYRRHSLSGFEKATLYKLTDSIKADFNGDGIEDKAYFQKENQNSGIIIKHGQTNEVVKIGFGKQFAHMTEFDWVDYWGLVVDKKTSETTFTEDGEVLGSKDVKLQNPSIALGDDELGGGLITFLNGKYLWIHQTS